MAARPVLGADGAFLSPPLSLSEADYIGLMIPQVFEIFGPPLRLYPLRGEQDWQDDVVFFYPDYRYLYWFQDRVWQIRFDRRFQGDIGGVRPGMGVEEVQRIFGTAHYIGEDNLYYDLDDRGYPVRLRLVFSEGILQDMYIYRSDF